MYIKRIENMESKDVYSLLVRTVSSNARKCLKAAIWPILILLFPIQVCAKDVRVGMYGVWAYDNKNEIFKLLDKYHFNTASGVGGKSVLDIADKYGIKCLVGIDSQLTRKIADDDMQWKKYLIKISEQVNKLKSHPAVLAWYFLDEPSWKKIPIEKIKIMNALIKSLDSNHPIYTVLSTPDRWQPYLPYFDIVAVDPYLRRDRKIIDNKPEVVRIWLRKIKKDVEKVKGNKPEIWVVIGAFEIRPKSLRCQSPFRKPTPSEFDKMLDFANTEGVDGIMIWTLRFKKSDKNIGWDLIRDDKELWDVVKKAPSIVGGIRK